MLYNDNAVSFFYKRTECLKQFLYVVEVQTGCRFIEYEQCRLLLFHPDEICQLHSLVLTSGKSGRTLSELYVSKSNLLERLQSVYDSLFSMFSKEINGF